MSTQALADGIKSLLAAATKAPCLDHDELQEADPLPDRYTAIYLSRLPGGNARGGTRENNQRLLQTRVAAKSVDDCRTLEDRIAEAFEHAVHKIDGTSVHFDFESGGGAYVYDKTTGIYESLTDWTFAV